MVVKCRVDAYIDRLVVLLDAFFKNQDRLAYSLSSVK